MGDLFGMYGGLVGVGILAAAGGWFARGWWHELLFSSSVTDLQRHSDRQAQHILKLERKLADAKLEIEERHPARLDQTPASLKRILHYG